MNDPFNEFTRHTFIQFYNMGMINSMYDYAERYEKYCKGIRLTPEYTNKDRLKNWWYSHRMGVGGGDFAICITI